MATLRDIRQRINAVSNTAKITQAMRMVAAAKMRKAQEAISSARPYFKKMNEVLTNLVENIGEEYSHPLIQKRAEVKNIAVIIVGSDRGLCGSFNNNLFKFALNYLKELQISIHPKAKIRIIPVGKKTCSFFAKSSFEIIKPFAGIFQGLSFSTVKEIISLIDTNFELGNIDKVIVMNNEFVNLITQAPSANILLPIDPSNLKVDVSIGRKKKKKVEEETKAPNVDYIFEPDRKEILDELLPKNLDIQLWRALLESNAAEQAARMMAMETATNNAVDLIKHLQLVFNKARQAAITKEMLEIVSGAEAQRKG